MTTVTDREDHSRYDFARVVDVDPIVRHIKVTTPRRECYTETRYEEVRSGYDPRRGSAGSMILGGIIAPPSATRSVVATVAAPPRSPAL